MKSVFWWIVGGVLWLFLSTAQSCEQNLYTIQSGDTCSHLLASTGLSREAFAALNHGTDCSDLHLRAGQRVCLHIHSSLHGESTCSVMYGVKMGDSCQSILTEAKISESEFFYINPFLNCSNLQVGDQICVAPCGEQSASAFSSDKASSHALWWSSDGKILLDYIGGTGKPIQFADVDPILSDNINVYFVLAFAIDADISGAVQDGNFSGYWISALTPSSISTLKARHSNVKVLLSLSGYSQYISATGATRIIEWYDPNSPTSWIENAFNSVSSLVRTYHLDGIDIDYETFPQSQTFVLCIGTLIQKLKTEKVIEIATMAPYNSTHALYKQLYDDYEDYIDYVNYQFYADESKTTSDYVDLYNRVAGLFPRSKLLASTEVMGRGLQGNDFFSALKVLEREPGGVPGMFLWTADVSKENGFLVEKVGQCIL